MSEEIFRPQRPNTNNPAQQHFNASQQFEHQPEHLSPTAHHPGNQPAHPKTNPDQGVQITGNIPPQLLERMQKKKAKDSEVQAAPSLGSFSANMSSNLLSILETLKSQSHHFEEVKLPSLGRFYDGTDGPTNGIIHIRPMTGEEEQILATPRFVKKGIAVNMIFSRCIQEPIKPENLLSVDRTFLLIYLRGISYGTDYEVEIKDPESDRKFTTVIDLDTLEIEPCPNDYGPELTDVLPKSGLTVNYRLSRGRDETALQEYRDKKLRQAGDSSTDDSLLYRTAMLVDDIQGVTDKNELNVLLKNLPIQDVSYLRNLVTEPPFGIDTKVTIISPISSDEFEIELPLEANFFFPRGKKKEKTQA